MISTIDNLKLCLNEILSGHDEFDDACRREDHDAMILAQAKIEQARRHGAIAALQYETYLENLDSLDKMMEE